jgi:hypothetical protein
VRLLVCMEQVLAECNARSVLLTILLWVFNMDREEGAVKWRVCLRRNLVYQACRPGPFELPCSGILVWTRPRWTQYRSRNRRSEIPYSARGRINTKLPSTPIMPKTEGGKTCQYEQRIKPRT